MPLKRFLLSLDWTSLLHGVHVRGKAKPFQVEQPKRIPMLPLNMLNDTLSIWTSLPVCMLVSAVHCLSFLLSSVRGALPLMFTHCDLSDGNMARDSADHACVASGALNLLWYV